MEDDVWELFNAGIAVDLLVPTSRDTCTDVGIRLRPYSKRLPAHRMVLGAGPTFIEALEDALVKAKAGRWESLNWSARPWGVSAAPNVGLYGL